MLLARIHNNKSLCGSAEGDDGVEGDASEAPIVYAECGTVEIVLDGQSAVTAVEGRCALVGGTSVAGGEKFYERE
ncbi:unnamed protein product [Peniophora sp. CBMAI 1063]|nr:unnamed protein product [Peniophora sp. CBMAI 1063]